MMETFEFRSRATGLMFFALCCALTPAVAQEYHGRDCPGGTACSSYGFVDANVTVKGPVRKRVKVTSNVFSFCGLEITADKIAADARGQIEQDVRNRFGDAFEITYSFVSTEVTREKAEQSRTKEMKNPEYTDYLETRYSYVAYSGKCHN
jgi:hypothetical protein